MRWTQDMCMKQNVIVHTQLVRCRRSKYPSPITRMCSFLRTREHATYTLCAPYALRRSDLSAQKG